MVRPRLSAQLGQKLVGRESGLFQDTRKRADLQFCMIRHNASGRSAPHDNVTASLADCDKTQTLQDSHCFGARKMRQSRHAL